MYSDREVDWELQYDGGVSHNTATGRRTWWLAIAYTKVACVMAEDY